MKNIAGRIAIPATGAAAALLAIAFLGPVYAQEDGGGERAKIRRGFEIAPVPLNMAGKNYDLVGLGSYLVNANSDCNGCHTSGGPPNFEYLPVRCITIVNEGRGKTRSPVVTGKSSADALYYR